MVANFNKRTNIYGVGVNDWSGACSYIDSDGNKVSIKEYKLWRAMLSRCYSKYTKTVRPTYVNVIFDERWLSMSTFIQDISSLKGYSKSLTDNWVLDKDILIKGNTVYSLDTCCFVPPGINGTLTLRKLHRGKLPLGVSYNANIKKFIARCGFDGKRVSIGRYDTVEDAFNAYVIVKKKELVRLANKYKGEIDDRVYKALINYEFTLED